MNYKEKLLAKIVKDESGCWFWKGYKCKTGYGIMWFNGQNRFTHRISWIIFREDQPIRDLHVLHKCDNKLCVNPDHLFLGTELDNHRDKARKGRSARGEKNGSSKLKEYQVKQIRLLYKEIRSPSKLAKIFNVSKGCVKRIVNRKGWSYLK